MAVMEPEQQRNKTSTRSRDREDEEAETVFQERNKTLLRYNSTSNTITTNGSDQPEEDERDDGSSSAKDDGSGDGCEAAAAAFQQNKTLRFNLSHNSTSNLSTPSSKQGPSVASSSSDLRAALKESQRYSIHLPNYAGIVTPVTPDESEEDATNPNETNDENSMLDSSNANNAATNNSSTSSPSKKSLKKRPKLKKHSFTDEVMSNSFRINEGDNTSILETLRQDQFDLEEMRKELEEFDKRSFVVKFDCVKIMYMARRLGENPSVRFGAPIALGSECLSTKTLKIDEFEKAKELPIGKRRRRRKVPMLTGPQRLQMLKELGYQPNDIIKAAIKASEDRERRTKAAGMFIHEYGKGNILHYSADQEPDDEEAEGNKCCGWI